MGKLKRVIAGAVGGLAGAALMSPVHSLGTKLTARPSNDGEDATERVANALAATFTGRRLRRSSRQTGGRVVHYAFAACVGAMYGLLTDEYPALTIGAGSLLGTAVYAGAHAVVVPSLGLARSPIRNGFGLEGSELAAHVVYGLVTDACLRVLC